MSASNTERARHYYNEWDKYAAEWLRNLIAAGHLPPGDVDTRSIADVQPDDLVGYTQCHFFAGIGGWALAARLAGWPDDRELWTGSCPCQPFSVAGKGAGADDERHLWPHQLRLLRARRPAVWMGEQVAAAVGKDWLDGVLSDLEGIGYAGRAVIVPACAVDGPHRRDRLWIVADASGSGLAQRECEPRVLRTLEGQPEGQDATDDAGAMGHADSSPAGRFAGGISGAQGSAERSLRGEPDGFEDAGAGCVLADSASIRLQRPIEGMGCGSSATRGKGCAQADGAARLGASAWNNAAWIIGHDGKARRVEPGIRLLAHGVPARVGRLRAYGNAIVPQVAAEVIAAYMECRP